ncbi:MAG: hypothetical protein EXX96DRAFT_620082 [Benjaminiella poitrasii]|nr:MAG: hypothetical protein EXX96DRAFT_620082 [Benjaminiella poitrasii]
MNSITHEVIHTSSPSPSEANTSTIFSPIENRSDMLEHKSEMSPQNDKSESTNTSKRYVVSPIVKNNFYAIHHVQRCSAKENEPSSPIIKSEIETIEMSSPPCNEKKTLTVDASPLTPPEQRQQPESNKRKRARPKQRQQLRHSLFQTCIGLWPASSSSHLGDMSYDYIKSLSDLLKVRLCQATFKMMTKCDQDDDLFNFLSEEYMSPKPKRIRHPSTVRLITNPHIKSTLAVVGNGRNLFRRQKQYHHRSLLVRAPLSMDHTQHQAQKPPRHYKKKTAIASTMTTSNSISKTPVTTATTPKTRRVMTTPKRRSAAADVLPVTLSDGSCYYVCEPCNKKYKNRNGLAYHLERCKHAIKPSTEDGISNSNSDEGGGREGGGSIEDYGRSITSIKEKETNNTDLICTENKDEKKPTIQCEQCKTWFYTDCVGISTPKDNDTPFNCLKCINDTEPVLSEANQVGQDLLQCLLDASGQLQQEQEPEPEQEKPLTSSQMSDVQLDSQQLQNLFNQITTPIKDESDLFPDFLYQNEDEDVLSSITTPTKEDDNSEAGLHSQSHFDSSQLHIWDDFNVNSSGQQIDDANSQQWQNNSSNSMLEDEDLFSSYDTDFPSSSLTMSDLHLFSNPPSLLFSDTTMNSSHEDDPIATTIDIPSASSELSPTPFVTIAAESSPITENDLCESNRLAPDATTTPGAASTSSVATDSLWFQFANFDDDYQCESQ